MACRTRRWLVGLAVWVTGLGGGGQGFATMTHEGRVELAPQAGHEAVLQIYGRHCEYHREEVEAALRAFDGVRQVEFLNNHGTVLVHYQSGGETAQQFADAVDRALTMGWNCSVGVDRGEEKRVTNQQEGRP